MPTNTLFKPLRVSEFTLTDLNYAGKGISASCAPNSSTNIDLTVSDDVMVTGMQIITNNGNYGDYAKLQIIDPSNMMGLGAGAVLNQFADTWYLPPTSDVQFDVAYPAKIIAGLALRVVYTNTGLVVPNAFIAINYKFHKVLR